jgi:hypothetical protein
MREDDARSASLRSLLNPSLAVLLPFLFLQAMDAVVRLGIASGGIPMPPGSLAVVFLMGVARTLVAGFLKREHVSDALSRVREAILLFAAAWLLLTLLSGRPFRGDFSPANVDLIWPLVLSAAQWLLTTYVHDALQPWEQFLFLFLSRASGKTGHKLAAAAWDMGAEAGESHQGLGRLTALATVLEVLSILPYIGLCTVLAVQGNPAPATGITARLLLFAVSGVAFMVVLNGFRGEQAVLLAGIAPDPGRSMRRSAGPCAGVLGLFAAALLLPGRRALLPLSVIRRFFEWLAGLWPKAVPIPPEPPVMSSSDPMPGGDLSELLGLGAAKVNPLLTEIVHIAEIVLAAAAAAAIVWFVIRPLFSRDARRSLRGLHPLRAAARRLRSLLRFLARLPGALAAWVRSPGRGLSSISRAVIAGIRESAADARRAAEARDRTRRVARGRAVHEFRRLARWGGKGGVAFTETEGPMEYVRLLAARWPDKAAPLGEAGLLFEELVYAQAPAGRGERALARIVDGIVR